jgi:hypothetical protein
MEKVLRKVKCFERLPIKNEKYFCIDNSNQLLVCHFDPHCKSWMKSFLYKENVEYWYEEVSLEELLKEAFEAARSLETVEINGVKNLKAKYEEFENYLKEIENG